MLLAEHNKITTSIYFCIQHTGNIGTVYWSCSPSWPIAVVHVRQVICTGSSEVSLFWMACETISEKGDIALHILRHFFLIFVNQTKFCIIITFFRLIWHRTEFGLMPNQLEKCNYNPNLVWFNKIQKIILGFEK